MEEKSDNIIEIKNLTKRFTLDSGFFARKDRFVYAVNDVSFSIKRGETYGLVGESGCGKSTTAKLIARMYRPDKGQIDFFPAEKKIDSPESDKNESTPLIKYIFQDPARSLNPRMTVYSILTDGLKYSERWPGEKAARKLAEKIIEEVGLDKTDLDRRPSEFSGGQRQRISIARGLFSEPELLICDEVVSALDVSIQGQILNLLQEIRAKRNLSCLFIAHDLCVSCYFCDRIGVMYRGVLVEEGRAEDFYKKAVHPYSKLLFAGASGKHENTNDNAEVKTALSKIEGCPFAHRCPKVQEKCKNELPPWTIAENKNKVRCFFPCVAE